MARLFLKCFPIGLIIPDTKILYITVFVKVSHMPYVLLQRDIKSLYNVAKEGILKYLFELFITLVPKVL